MQCTTNTFAAGKTWALNLQVCVFCGFYFEIVQKPVFMWTLKCRECCKSGYFKHDN